MFQLLIVKIKTDKPIEILIKRKRFQFLIVKIKTESMNPTDAIANGFQFLIVKIKTPSLLVKFVANMVCFNSS